MSFTNPKNGVPFLTKFEHLANCVEKHVRALELAGGVAKRGGYLESFLIRNMGVREPMSSGGPHLHTS